MANGTMELIQTVTVTGATAANVEFTNIPNTYNDLKIVFSARNSTGDVDNVITLNTSTTVSNTRRLYGTGSSVASDTAAGGGLATPSSATASTFSSTEYYFPNYTGTTNKSVSIDAVNETNGTNAYSNLSTQLFTLGSAITSIKIAPNSGLYVTYTTATLYGITRVPAGAKATGGVIYDDSSYWYHVFTSSGTFTPSQNITCDYLVVAGGGAGGAADAGPNDWSGGGGAGGLRSTVGTTGGGGSLESPLSLLATTNYTVTIGAGGSGGSASWTSGSNSVFSTITSTGGGLGSGLNTVPAWVNPATGGSGGGGSEFSGAGASGTSNQGFGGGSATTNAGGGGGGAGAIGVNATTSNGGAGGAGVSISALATATSTGVSNFYAGGGGGSGAGSGGAGGSGGGGAGSNGTATAGTANTGGGGGSGSRSGAAGGSGIVIVRYAK